MEERAVLIIVPLLIDLLIPYDSTAARLLGISITSETLLLLHRIKIQHRFTHRDVYELEPVCISYKVVT